MTGHVREVLVVELLGGFGDVLLALPAVHALARSHAGARVRVLTFAPGADLLARDPHVAELIVASDHREGAPRAAVERELSRRRYDLVVTTTTYDGIAAVCRAGAPRAVTDLWAGAPADELVDRRFLRLLVAAGAVDPRHAQLPPRVHLDHDELAGGEAALAALVPDGGEPVVLVPGSGMPVKQWPQQRWAALAAALRVTGRSVLTAAVDGRPVPGTTPLPPSHLCGLAAQLAAVGVRGGVVIGGDTGPVRLATAVGTRAVALYGPTAARRYGLRPDLGTSLQGLPTCPVRVPSALTEQECWWTAHCPLSAAGPACMADLTVDDVLAALARS